MSKITLNAEAAAALAAVMTESELCGPDGRPLGMFIPPELAAEVEALLKRRRFYREPTLDELKAADEAGGEIPHEEVMKLLGLETVDEAHIVWVHLRDDHPGSR
jgi:hypothetical protein